MRGLKVNNYFSSEVNERVELQHVRNSHSDTALRRCFANVFWVSDAMNVVLERIIARYRHAESSNFFVRNFYPSANFYLSPDYNFSFIWTFGLPKNHIALRSDIASAYRGRSCWLANPNGIFFNQLTAYKKF